MSYGNLFIHNKTGNKYEVMAYVINCTNAQDGQTMALYGRYDDDGLQAFVREISEFDAEFTEVVLE